MKIDMFCHVFPPRYYVELRKRMVRGEEGFHVNDALIDVDARFRILDQYPDVVQVLTLSSPHPEAVAQPEDHLELTMMANDELAELIAKYPNRFLAGVANLPLLDIDAALKEADRAITELGFRGVQVFTSVDGEYLDSPKFRPLLKKMAEYDLPIWVHPWSAPHTQEAALGWPLESTYVMMRLAASGIFLEHPGIKIITHHCGGLVPFFQGRLYCLGYEGRTFKSSHGERGGLEVYQDLRRFYVDTAIAGTEEIWNDCTPSLTCAYDFYGADHMLLGTDMPLGGDTPRAGHTGVTIRSIDGWSIPAEDKAKIYSENAKRLLRL